MKPRKNIDSAEAALTLRSALWALSYLALIGICLGYALKTLISLVGHVNFRKILDPSKNFFGLPF